MSSSRRIGTLIAALALAVPLGLLVGGSAVADPGDGNGKGTAAAPGQTTNNGNGPDHSRGNRGTSGDPTQPQPGSNADFSGHGANVHGPYDSTRDGSPSGNGVGDGKAVGKPCAGCVGKADNKNPPGQLPGGSDPNAGYECDRNQGIGKTNPAHTGCREAPTTPPPPGNGNGDGNGNGNGKGNGGVGGGAPPKGQPPADEQPGGLPVTGESIAAMIGAALLLMLTGTALRRLGRRRA